MTAETAGLSMDEIRDRDAEAQGSRMFAALLAAGREALALEVASTLLMHIDRPRARIALVARAMDAGHFDPVRDRRWLDEALLARPAPVELEQAASSGSGMTPALRVGG